jgi:hypothetical protein
MIHAFQQLRAVSRARLHKLPVDQKKWDYLVWVEGI